MNHCRDIELELVAYGSGDLSPADRDRVRNHLDSCDECRAELVREMNLRETLAGLPRASAPVGLDDLIHRAIPSAGNRTGSRKERYRLVTAFAVVAASLALAFILPALRPTSGPAPTASDGQQAWTEREIAVGREEVMFSLSLATRILDRTQKDAVIEVFSDRLPRAVNESLKLIKPTNSGGNG